jgi:hypothetical protein
VIVSGWGELVKYGVSSIGMEVPPYPEGDRSSSRGSPWFAIVND